METNEPSPGSFERLPLSCVAQFHTYIPASGDEANPVIIETELKKGERDGSARGWRRVSTFRGHCFYPHAPSPQSVQAYTLGNRMISQGFGWEYHSMEYVLTPSGYVEWGTAVLNHHCTNLKGDGEGTDYIYGAIYCSLGRYSISLSLFRSFLERWNPETNTFIFADGERTITLLDMLRLAGLPLDGEFYEEFVPSRHEQDPSLLCYPKCLSQLLRVWDKLQVGGEVSFQEWCDHFHNTPRGPPNSDDADASLTYKAAFLALWLCSFVVVGGGSLIRPGVFVMASWMAMGRRYALAQPALCSLYYSLRLISTNPVGPSYLNRSWSVHYIIGWMGAYFKNIFGDRMRGAHVLAYNHALKKPMMANIMFRIPTHFNSVGAFDFLCKDANILWSPYKPKFSDRARAPPPAWIRNTFYLSLRRGMLPWRRAGLCIAEPYHPDRVARQFRLDQVIPFLPLASLYTVEDFGIAHAYWRHILRPVQDNLPLLPDDSITGQCTVHWLKWYKKFSEPFNSILDALSHGIAVGKVPYQDRKKRAVDNVIVSRRLSHHDLFVVHEVPEQRRAQHAEFIKSEVEEFTGPWKKALCDFLRSGTLPSIRPFQVYAFPLFFLNKISANLISHFILSSRVIIYF